MLVPDAVAVPWLAAVVTATLVGVPVTLSVIGFADESYATVAEPATDVGAPDAGVTEFDAADAGPVPMALVAVTVKV